MIKHRRICALSMCINNASGIQLKIKRCVRCPVLPCVVLRCPVLSCVVLRCHVLPCVVMRCPVLTRSVATMKRQFSEVLQDLHLQCFDGISRTLCIGLPRKCGSEFVLLSLLYTNLITRTNYFQPYFTPTVNRRP